MENIVGRRNTLKLALAIAQCFIEAISHISSVGGHLVESGQMILRKIDEFFPITIKAKKFHDIHEVGETISTFMCSFTFFIFQTREVICNETANTFLQRFSIRKIHYALGAVAQTLYLGNEILDFLNVPPAVKLASKVMRVVGTACALIGDALFIMWTPGFLSWKDTENQSGLTFLQKIATISSLAYHSFQVLRRSYGLAYGPSGLVNFLHFMENVSGSIQSSAVMYEYIAPYLATSSSHE